MQVEQAITDKESLLGHDVDLIREGSDCTPEGVLKAATRLALHAELLAVIYPECGADIINADHTLEDAGIAILRPPPSNVYPTINLFFTTIEKTAVHGAGKTLYFPRTAVREALENLGYQP